MSYHRPSKQSLADPLGEILDGIVHFDEAVMARIESSGFSPEHTTEINDLSVRLMSLRGELSEMKRRNW